MSAMDDHLPLPTLRSQVLVAFTIEFDNAEQETFAELLSRVADHVSGHPGS
jgi:hypothetical protein